MFPIGLAELPEGAAHRIEPGGRHVDRAESAVSGVVDRAEHAGKVTGERLRLIAAGIERESVRIARADRGSRRVAMLIASSQEIASKLPEPRDRRASADW